MVQAAPNKLQARFCQELSRQLSLHRVVLLFDPAEQLRSLLDAPGHQPAQRWSTRWAESR
jgi:hypothetical protein